MTGSHAPNHQADLAPPHIDNHIANQFGNRRARIIRALLLLLAIVLGLAIAFCITADAQSFPALSGRVVDQADLLNKKQEAALSDKLEQLEDRSGRQLAVATLSDLQDYDIADYGYQLGRYWGIGSAENDDGALLIVAPNERKLRIEIGYGLEGVVTDALSGDIIRNTITPYFRDDDYYGGIDAGVDRLISQLTLPEEEARAFAKQLEQDQRNQGSKGNPIMFIFWLLVLIFIVIPFIISAHRRGKKYHGKGSRDKRNSGAGPIIIWGDDDDFWGGGSGGGWGGGGSGGGWGGSSGGGGFSGGGGSFGGGGASGGW